MDLKDIETLITLLKQNDISEFELEHDGTKLKLQRGSRITSVAASSADAVSAPMISAAPMNGSSIPVATSVTPAVNPGWVEVKSPIVGTFYRKPSPDAELFVKEGDRVSKGDTLCIIEAMKLMNEIEAPADGRIEKILLSDAKVVEYGEVLFLLNPSA